MTSYNLDLIIVRRRRTMADIEILTYSFDFNSDQGPLGLSTNALVESQTNLVDTGQSSRRRWLYEALESKNLAPEDVDVVILTHVG